jgi:hypothetical protein
MDYSKKTPKQKALAPYKKGKKKEPNTTYKKS